MLNSLRVSNQIPQWNNFFVVMSSSPPLNGEALSLMFLSRLYTVYHLWTDRCPDLLPSIVLKLSRPVRHLWTDESITLFSFPPSGSGVFAVKLVNHLWTTNYKPGVS